MSEPTLTREAWRRLTLSAYGLTALAGAVDDLIADVRFHDRDKQDRLSGLVAALLSLTQSVEETITKLDEEENRKYLASMPKLEEPPTAD